MFGICQPTLFNQKQNVGWFLLRIVDLLRICLLYIISRHYFNTLLFINQQKRKTCPRNKYCRKDYLFWYRYVTLDRLHICFKMAPVVEIVSFDPPKTQKKTRSVIFSSNSKYRVYHWRIGRFHQKMICGASC